MTRNLQMRTAIQAVRHLDGICPVANSFHMVIEDLNVDDESLDHCFSLIGGDLGQRQTAYHRDVVAAEVACYQALKPLTEDQREDAINAAFAREG